MSLQPRSFRRFVPTSLGAVPAPVHPRRRRGVPVLLGLTLLGLTACTSPVTVDPAPDAANPGCAPAMVAMPEQLAGLAQRETTAQATTAWGKPERIVLKCGVRVQEPTSDPCVTVNGVDWTLRRDETSETTAPTASPSGSAPGSQQAGGTWSATTYGRSPTIRVTFDSDQVASSTLLPQLESAVQQIPATKKCRSADDFDYRK